MRRINRNMCEGPMLGNIILYTIPIILTSVLQLLFNAADLVIVGRFCGSTSVGAVGATGSITNLIVSLFMGLSVGAGVSVAHALGANDWEAAHRTVHTAIPAAVIGGGVLTVIGIVFSKAFLELMDTPENVLPLSTLYMRIYFGGMIFNMLYNFGAAILRAAGDTKRPLIYLSFAGVLNVVLNVVFVTVFHMNVAGVALATTISQAVSAILVLSALMRRHDAISFSFKSIKFDGHTLKKMLTIGIPSGLQSSLFGISNVLIQSSVNSFGAIFVAGSASAGNIEGFVYVIMNSFYQTSLNFSGQNYGAGKLDRVKKSLLICALGAGISGFVSGGLTYVFGHQLLSIYITDSAQAISYGMIRISIVGTMYFFCGIMETITGAIRGMGSSIPPMIITVIGVCAIRIIWIYTIFSIPRFHTPECLFLSYPLTWVITIIAEFIAFRIIFKNKERQLAIKAEQ